ncbi:MAG: hypothetical protein PHP03_01735 [Candidatus Pacebacteria bacterium]|nr:hypothetical protein [Candidatus Paceibacterota bacterium]
MKRLLICLCSVFLFQMAFALTTPLKISVIPPVALFNSSANVIGADIGLILTRSRSVIGAQAGLVCEAEYSYICQYAVCYAKAKNAYGFQYALGYVKIEKGYGLVMTMVSNVGTYTGIQFGEVGYADKTVGVQISGIYGCTKELRGVLYTGFYAKTDKLYGISFGCVNITREAYGVQLGLYNYAETLKGVQIGLINVVRKNGVLPVMIGINAGFK